MPPGGIPLDLRIRHASNADESAIREVVYSALAEYGLAPDPSGTDADLGDLDDHYWKNGGVFHVVVSPEGSIVSSPPAWGRGASRICGGKLSAKFSSG